MDISLDSSLHCLRGVGEQRIKAFARLGIHTLFDLVTHFPRQYEDRTRIVSLDALGSQPACVEAQVAAPVRCIRARNGMELVKTRIIDDSGWADITFFNAPYVKDRLNEGDSYVFYGKLSGDPPQILNPLFEPADRRGLVTGRLIPLYPLTAGLSQGQVAACVRQALSLTREHMPDILPAQLRDQIRLSAMDIDLENIHFPSSPEGVDSARRRFVFEELLLLSLSLRRLKWGRREQTGPLLREIDLSDFYARLPFSLTGAQQEAIATAVADMCSGRCMNRLIQGDVGSGKTLVAAACALFVLRQGGQAALMTPTEILAEQHFRLLTALLEPLGQTVLLLTSGTKQKKPVLAQLAAGEPCLAIGTQALLSNRVEMPRLMLCITDEQHRFGVAQRRTLSDKGESPHRLVMSATPIPRSLALTLYGDLDITVMRERPPGRRPVETYIVDESMRMRVERFVRKLVAEGRQIYIVCPRVEEDDDGQGLRAAEEYTRHLQRKVFPDLQVGCVHGRMKPAGKEAVMRAFAEHRLDILVATTVIEVGVDVENAALIIVENAERYGLSQLHQLRGRVGRGSLRSYCILFSEFQGAVAKKRLHILRDTDDGFEIAERDLQLRGPGDFFGHRQHGLPPLKMADLNTDLNLLTAASNAAGKLLEEDPELEGYPLLRQRLETLFCGACSVEHQRLGS